MKRIFSGIAIAALLISCGEKKETKTDGFEVNRTKKEEVSAKKTSDAVPVDLSNKGVGPITDMSFDEEIDMALAKAGETKYQMICTACHMVGQRMIGPDLTGVYERRSPEWVMNMILNPDVMLKEDPIAKALLEEYNGAIMLNQNLSEEDARALAEYLRTL
jgi:mono/diheme cytochrome c family protein